MFIVKGGHQEDITTGYLSAGPRQPKAPEALLCLWNVCSAHCSHTRSCIKNIASRELRVIEAIWTVHVTEPSQGLYIDF